MVVASTRSNARLAAYLDALMPRCRVLGIEIVVVRACDAAELPGFVRMYPAVRFVEAPEGSSVAALKAAGMAAAAGDVVGLTDDDESIAPDWLHGLVEAWFHRAHAR